MRAARASRPGQRCGRVTRRPSFERAAFAARGALLVVGLIAGGAVVLVPTVGFGADADRAERALTIEGEAGGALTIDRGRVAVATTKTVRVWWPATGRTVRFAGGFVGPDSDLALARNLLAWTSSEEGISCQDEAYLADLSTRRRITLKTLRPVRRRDRRRRRRDCAQGQGAVAHSTASE